MIDYLVGEIGQKLSVRTALEKGYIRRTTIRVPMDPEDFDDLFSGLCRGRRRFDVTAEDLDYLLPDGWSERAFRTTNRCVVSRQQPIIIRFADQRKLHYDHSKCPRCGLHQKGCRNPCTVIIAQQSIFFTKVWTIHESTFYGISFPASPSLKGHSAHVVLRALPSVQSCTKELTLDRPQVPLT